MLLAAIFLFLVSRIIFVLFLLDVFLWIVYAHPKTLLKSKPVIPSFIHFFAGIIHFLFGYILFSGAISAKSLLIGIYFGFVFTAGHLNHEVKDFEFDKQAELNTNAIKFGKKSMFCLSFLLITMSSVFFCILTWQNILPPYLWPGLIAIYPFYLYYSYKTWSGDMDNKNMREFRSRYRALYAIAGGYMTIMLLINRIILK